MAYIVILLDSGNAAGGGDVTPNAINWGDITVTSGDGIEANSAQTLAGITSPITLRATWTSTSASPTKGQWIRNGVAVQAPALSPVDVTASVGDQLYWQTYCAYTHPSGNYDTGTVTVTNRSDSNATLDTFTFACQYVVTGGGGGGYREPPDIQVN